MGVVSQGAVAGSDRGARRRVAGGSLGRPAYAVCTSDKSNNHSIGSVPHGWQRFSCQPANNYKFNAWTNHGHGQKYVAIWDSVGPTLHCDNLASGSTNAACSTTAPNTSHYSYHDVAGVISCVDRFNDGHGFDCHEMEALP